VMGVTEAALTAEPIAGLAWFVVYSKPHKEGRAEFQLRRRGVEVFYPRLQLPGYVDPRRQIVPLFPGYLFVRIVLGSQFYDVVWAPGVSRFVGTYGLPTPLDDEVVAFLRANADADGLLRARPTLVVGQHVEITRGPFAGIVGIIQRPPNAKGRIRVLMRLLNRGTVGVELPLQFVKTGWTPASRGSEALAHTRA
jgi:transcription antitermination factor NusG